MSQTIHKRMRRGRRVLILDTHPLHAKGYEKGTVLSRVSPTDYKIRAERIGTGEGRWGSNSHFFVTHKDITIHHRFLQPLETVLVEPPAINQPRPVYRNW